MSIARRADGSFQWSRFEVKTRLQGGVLALRGAASTQTALGSVTISVQRRLPDGLMSPVYQTITLGNVLVISSGAAAVTGDSDALETIDFDFQTIAWTVAPIEASASLGTPVAFSWDRATSTGSAVSATNLTFSSDSALSLVTNPAGASYPIGGAISTTTSSTSVVDLGVLLEQQVVPTLTTILAKNVKGVRVPYLTETYPGATLASISLSPATETISWTAPATTLRFDSTTSTGGGYNVTINGKD